MVEGEGLAVVISCNPIWGGGGAPREIFIGTARGRLQRQEGIRRWKVNTRRIGGKMCRSRLNSEKKKDSCFIFSANVQMFLLSAAT